MLNMARYRKSQVSMISRVTLVWYSSISEIVLKWKTNQQSRWYQEFTSTSSIRIIQLYIRITNTKHSSTSTSTLKTNLRSRWYQEFTSTSSTRMTQLYIRITNTKHNSTSTSTLKTNLQSRWYQECTSSTPASPPSSSRCNRGASAGSTRTWDFHDWENIYEVASMRCQATHPIWSTLASPMPPRVMYECEMLAKLFRKSYQR